MTQSKELLSEMKITDEFIKHELLHRLMHMLDLVQTEIVAENDNYLPMAELNQLLIDLVKAVRDK